MSAENLEEVCRDEVFISQPAARVKHEVMELLGVAAIDVLNLITPCR
jgi:hypothetical protein